MNQKSLTNSYFIKQQSALSDSNVSRDLVVR